MQRTASKDGLTVTAHMGDGMVLLAFDLDAAKMKDLAGFAIKCTPKGTGQGRFLLNRLDFDTGVSRATTEADRPYTPSDKAPFQKFRWYHVPSDLGKDGAGSYVYETTAMYFAGGGVKPGVSVSLEVVFEPIATSRMCLGFTRGYLTSQAYARLFHNADIRPKGPKGLFDTTPFEAQYAWLGYHARKLVFDFLDACLQDPGSTIDVFAYDLDEPRIIEKLCAFGKRLRIVLDDSPLHVKQGAVEQIADQKLVASAGAENVHRGHFSRFSHCKVLIQKVRGQPARVLTGSANFSVRGLYVQANNVMVIDDPTIAGWYARAFQQAFDDMHGFSASPIASQWFDAHGAGLPRFSVAFSPHEDPALSLDPVASAVSGAKSSVLFAVMELGGGGEVLDRLRNLAADGHVFSYGVTQAASGLHLYKPGSTEGVLVGFDALDRHVPPPFDKEWRGGPGQVIHDKFVVCDFNGENPVVFTGSSNLASGGERSNGDNLIAIHDPEFVTAFAVEAIRLVDHYHFRDAMEQADPAAPLKLQGPDPRNEAPWYEAYYDERDLKSVERELFIRVGH
jgi:hypothetical protein